MSGRGRGKRASVKTVIEHTSKEEVIADLQQEPVAEKAPKKTTKKKQFPVVAVVTPDGIEGSLLGGVRRPLIVHLPIQSKNVPMNDMPIMYDPLPPTEAQPYDSHADNPFCDEVELLPDSKEGQEETVKEPINTIEYSAPANVVPMTQTAEPEIDYYNLKSTLLVQFKDSSDVKAVPMQSTAACFWCCHGFTNRPVVLPIRDTGDHLLVTGNFCSPECASAYLFDMRQDAHTRWEQLALLYRVYGEACNGNIHPAPPRSILQLFGGSLSIQDYRKLLQSHQVRVDIHLPPMVSILATMDTKPIDFYDASLTKNVNETVKERLQKAEEVLRLRRTKPLKAWESTLDACLNLKIRA
jgi:MYM-type Zinc finger with FCS sequence motif